MNAWEYIDAVGLTGIRPSCDSSAPAPPPSCELVSMRAESATSSSTWGPPYGPSKAIGAPDFEPNVCGTEQGGSWAPLRQDQTEHRLTLKYAQPVFARRIQVNFPRTVIALERNTLCLPRVPVFSPFHRDLPTPVRFGSMQILRAPLGSLRKYILL